MHAIKVFQASVFDTNIGQGNSDGVIEQTKTTEKWLSAVNASRWSEMPDPTMIPGWDNIDKQADAYDFGTSWAREVIEAAATKLRLSTFLTLESNDLSQKVVADAPGHKSHEAGIDIDIETKASNSQKWVHRQMKCPAQNQGNHSVTTNSRQIATSTTLKASMENRSEPRMDANGRE